MTSQELKARYAELYEDMRKSKDVGKMKVFGTGFTKMFDRVANTAPDIAAMTIDFLSAIEYYNYVTQVEAMDVASHFINDDMKISGATEPSKGAHWGMETLKSFLVQKGLPLEEAPYYNWPSLWLVVNMEYSDYANAFFELMGKKDNEAMAVAAYTFAVKKLKDRDRHSFIREYFDLDD
jgi:hypothetical protein